MKIFGLILMILIYTLLILILGLFIFNMITKKYEKAFKIKYCLFVFLLFSIMALSWSLVIMNKSFNINYKISIDYSWLIFPFLILILIIVPFDMIARSKITILSESIAKTVLSIILNAFILVGLTVATGLLYFGINYFMYLSI